MTNTPASEGVTILEAMARFDVPVSPVTGWETLSAGSFFEPEGVMLHHTASNSTGLSVIRDGNGYTPGPLSQVFIETNPFDYVFLVSDSRCNHAGRGDFDVLDRMRNEEPVRAGVTSHPTNTGNGYFYGIEIEGAVAGDFPVDGYRYQQAVNVTAAYCWWKGWNPLTRVVAHKEWAPDRKVDPAFDMNTFRQAVVARLLEVEEPMEIPAWAEGSVEAMYDRGVFTENTDLFAVEVPLWQWAIYLQRLAKSIPAAVPGPQGPKGDKGDKGDKGAKGAKGDPAVLPASAEIEGQITFG